MNTRLYRLTPAGGKPNHYTDSYASALAKCDVGSYHLAQLPVGAARTDGNGVTVERVA
jgi:hypothetical protein